MLTVKNAHWIWAGGERIPDDKVVFVKRFSLDKAPASAPTVMACDTKYWLYINGACVVREGGLFRESRPGCGYADTLDIAPHLVSGENTVALLCWYFGNSGRNSVDSGNAGLLFSCDAIGVHSGASFACMRHPAYVSAGDPPPSYLFAGHNIGYDMNLDIGDFAAPGFDHPSLAPAVELDGERFGALYPRPIPLHRFAEPVFIESSRLPHAMTFNPVIRAIAKGGEVLELRTDRFRVNGGPGDHHHSYLSHRVSLTLKPGLNEFESIDYLYGEQLIVTSHPPLETLEIGYRESGFDADIVGHFSCDDPLVGALVQKSARTLYVCMRDNFMDCPDRERGQWIGDVSAQAPQVAFLLDERAQKLLRKAALDFIYLRRGRELVGNVPGNHAAELPPQSLNAIGPYGLIAQYHKYTGDTTVLEEAFDPCVDYLKLWQTGPDGLLLPRKGNWRWFDHLYNIDEAVLENAWTYAALGYWLKTGELLGYHAHDAFLTERMAGIREGFESFWMKDRFYSSQGVVDDRANALAALSGLCPPERFPQIRDVLLSVFNATIYMENYVLIALCEMGYTADAYRRMMSRYHNLALNDNTTLWEDFFILGTKNHAWSGAPATIALSYFAGVHTNDGFATFTINPVQGLFERMQFTFAARGGTVSVHVEHGKVTRVDNRSRSLWVGSEG